MNFSEKCKLSKKFVDRVTSFNGKHGHNYYDFSFSLTENLFDLNWLFLKNQQIQFKR